MLNIANFELQRHRIAIAFTKIVEILWLTYGQKEWHVILPGKRSFTTQMSYGEAVCKGIQLESTCKLSKDESSLHSLSIIQRISIQQKL